MSVTVAAFLLCVCIASNVIANVNVCSLEPESGPGADQITKWYHVNCVCKVFIYGGFGGNQNNFDTREECEQKFIVCNLPAVTGHCRAHIPSWYYDNGVCKKFVYGGCRGNDNRFGSRDACQRACTIKTQQTSYMHGRTK